MLHRSHFPPRGKWYFMVWRACRGAYPPLCGPQPMSSRSFHLTECLRFLSHRIRLPVVYTRNFMYRISRVPSPSCISEYAVEDCRRSSFSSLFPPNPTTRITCPTCLAGILDSWPLSVSRILGTGPTNVLQRSESTALLDFLNDTDIVYNYSF